MRLLVVIHIIVAHRLPSPMVLLAITPLAEITVSPDSTPNHLDIFFGTPFAYTQATKERI